MEKCYNTNQQMHRLPSNLNDFLIYVNSYMFRAALAHCLDGQVRAFVSLHCNKRVIMHGMENVTNMSYTYYNTAPSGSVKDDNFFSKFRLFLWK
jgi:hypothetical protein